MGGEPLLNKNCKDYMYILRQYFQQSRIWIITNGILLPKQDESFWKACQDNNIELHPTKYPIQIDWDFIKQQCHTYNIPIIFFNNEQVEKTSFKTCLNPKGDSDPFDNFVRCHRANHCNQLKNGKIYPCSVAANITHFNNYFDEKLELSAFDSIDIHADNIIYQDILHFVSKPIPFCRYCDIKKMTTQTWLNSKKRILVNIMRHLMFEFVLFLCR